MILKRTLFLMVVVALLLVAASPSLAHDPQIEAGDWGDFAAPFPIPVASVSYALYGYLDENDVDVFQLDFDQADALLRTQLIVPVCGEHYVDFYPQLVILAPQVEALTPLDLDLPFDLPDGVVPIDTSLPAADAAPEATPELRPTFVEAFGGTEFYDGPSHDLRVPTAGTYWVAVFDPAGMTGDYTLATGYQEVFNSANDQLITNVLVIRSGDWLHRRCDLASGDPNAILEHDHHDE